MRLDYRPRRIQFHDRVERSIWTLKVYHLLHGDKEPDPALATAAVDEAMRMLPGPDDGPEHYGVGFVGVHQGKSYDFVLIGYWAYQTELRYQAYMRPTSQSYRLEPARGSLTLGVVVGGPDRASLVCGRFRGRFRVRFRLRVWVCA